MSQAPKVSGAMSKAVVTTAVHWLRRVSSCPWEHRPLLPPTTLPSPGLGNARASPSQTVNGFFLPCSVWLECELELSPLLYIFLFSYFPGSLSLAPQEKVHLLLSACHTTGFLSSTFALLFQKWLPQVSTPVRTVTLIQHPHYLTGSGHCLSSLGSTLLWSGWQESPSLSEVMWQVHRSNCWLIAFQP